MTIIKKLTNKCCRGSREKETLLHCWWECKLIKLLRRTVWRSLKKLGIKLSHDPAIPLPGIYSEKTTIQKEIRTPLFTAALFTTAKTWKQNRRPSTDEQIKKLWHVYTMEYYSVIKRNESESVEVRSMNPEPIICSEVSHKEKNLSYINAYTWDLEKWY